MGGGGLRVFYSSMITCTSLHRSIALSLYESEGGL